MKVAVVLNLSAGTLLGMPGEAAAAAIARTFAAAGAEVETAAIEAAQCAGAIRRAADGDAEVVVIGGGDGTILTAANALMPKGKALGVLPLGTMNLLARDLGLPLDLDEATAALAHGSIRPIDVAEVNGEVFLNNSVLGIYPAMVQERERQRGRNHLSKWPAMGLAAFKALYHFPTLDVELDLGNGPVRVRTPILAVSNNAYDKGYGPVLRRSSLDAGQLGVYIARHRHAWSLMKLGARMALGTWAEDEELERRTASVVTVFSRRRRLRVANDGEVRRMKPPLVYRMHPRALNVLMPGPATGPKPRKTSE